MTCAKNESWKRWLTPTEAAELEKLEGRADEISRERYDITRRTQKLRSRATWRRANKRMPRQGPYVGHANVERVDA